MNILCLIKSNGRKFFCNPNQFSKQAHLKNKHIFVCLTFDPCQ